MKNWSNINDWISSHIIAPISDFVDKKPNVLCWVSIVVSLVAIGFALMSITLK